MEYTSYLTDFYISICLCLILREYEEKGNKCQQIEFYFTIFHSIVLSEIHKEAMIEYFKFQKPLFKTVSIYAFIQYQVRNLG